MVTAEGDSGSEVSIDVRRVVVHGNCRPSPAVSIASSVGTSQWFVPIRIRIDIAVASSIQWLIVSSQWRNVGHGQVDL